MDRTFFWKNSALDVDWELVGSVNLYVRSMYSHLEFVPVKFFLHELGTWV